MCFSSAALLFFRDSLRQSAASLHAEPLPNTELTDSAAKMEHNHEHLEGEQARDPFCITHPDTDWRACIAHAEKIGLGTSKYELIEVK